MASGLYCAPLLHAAAMIAFAVAVLSLSSPVCADDQIGDHWVATWGASPSSEWPPITFDNQSVRQIALVTIGGRGQRLRIRLSNELGAEDVIVGAAHIGLATAGGSILPNSDRTLTSSGEESVTIPAGAPVVLFAEGPTAQWALPLPEPVAGAPAGLQRFAFELDGLPPGEKASGAMLRLTAVAGDKALEAGFRLD